MKNPDLVEYVVSAIKTRIAAQEVRMTKAEAFDKAWKMAIKDDFKCMVASPYMKYTAKLPDLEHETT